MWAAGRQRALLSPAHSWLGPSSSLCPSSSLLLWAAHQHDSLIIVCGVKLFLRHTEGGRVSLQGAAVASFHGSTLKKPRKETQSVCDPRIQVSVSTEMTWICVYQLKRDRQDTNCDLDHYHPDSHLCQQGAGRIWLKHHECDVFQVCCLFDLWDLIFIFCKCPGLCLKAARVTGGLKKKQE